MELKDLAKGQAVLTGVDFTYGGTERYATNDLSFCLDGVVYVAEEDPDDGYRSTLKEIRVSDQPIKNTFPGIPVMCVMPNDILNIYSLLSAGVILRVGTDNTDDWYPMCIMEWSPKNIHTEAGKL